MLAQSVNTTGFGGPGRRLVPFGAGRGGPGRGVGFWVGMGPLLTVAYVIVVTLLSAC